MKKFRERVKINDSKSKDSQDGNSPKVIKNKG